MIDEFGYEKEPLRYAGFGLRLGSYLIDGVAITVVFYILILIMGLFGFAVIGGVGALSDLESGGSPSESAIIALVIAYFGMIFLLIIMYYLYFAIMESSKYQATLGKLAVGTIVTDMDGERISFGKALGRNLGKIISGMTCYVGYLMPLWTDKQQTLHDIMANCLVVEKPRDF